MVSPVVHTISFPIFGSVVLEIIFFQAHSKTCRVTCTSGVRYTERSCTAAAVFLTDSSPQWVVGDALPQQCEVEAVVQHRYLLRNTGCIVEHIHDPSHVQLVAFFGFPVLPALIVELKVQTVHHL